MAGLMYQVKVADVSGRIVTGENGERLYRIGNMPVSVGDFVWTDGAAVYGFFTDTDEPKPYVPKASGGIGIPLWAYSSHDTVFVYTRIHTIEPIRRLGQSEMQYFSNHERSYALLPFGNNTFDADDDSHESMWAIQGTGAYSFSQPCHFMYYYEPPEGAEGSPAGWYEERPSSFGQDCAELGFSTAFSWEVISHYSLTDAAYPENDVDETTTQHSENRETQLRIDHDTARETVTNDCCIVHGESASTISIMTFVDDVRRAWQARADSFGQSARFGSFITNITASIDNKRIDEKGRPSFTVNCYASGYAFKDVIVDGFSTITRYDHEHKRYGVVTVPVPRNTQFTDEETQTTSASETTGTSTLMASVQCTLKIVVDAGSGRTYGKTENWSVLCNQSPLDLGGVSASAGTSFGFDEFHNTKSGIITPVGTEIVEEHSETYIENDAPKTPPNTPQMWGGEDWLNDFYLPIQDGYSAKNADFTAVYKDGVRIMSDAPFSVGGVVAVDKKSYLVIPIGGGRVALYRDGRYTILEFGASELFVTNTRLRYISTRGALEPHSERG